MIHSFLKAHNHIPSWSILTPTTSSRHMIASRLIVKLTEFHIWVQVFIIRIALSSMIPLQYKIMEASITWLVARSIPIIDGLTPSGSPNRCSRLMNQHNLWLLSINKRGRTQTLPRGRWARVCYKLQYLLHLLLKKFCFTIWELNKPLRLPMNWRDVVWS